MKKITTFFFLLLITILSIKYQYKNKENKIIIIPEKNPAIINKYYIYGTKLNIEGEITNINSQFIRGDIIFHNSINNNIIIYKLNYTKKINNLIFNISNEINNGIHLDYIPKGTYTTYIRLVYDNNIEKYYSLINNTPYKKTKYYTLSKINNLITINTTNNNFNIKVNNNNQKTYDIVIDPSRGGNDKGTTGNGYTESDITMNFAIKIKEKLEKEGLSVKLTRTLFSLKENEHFDEYNTHGRAIIPHENHAKYVFSLHTNSSPTNKTKGLSIYTAANINYDLSTSIIENIVNNSPIKPAKSNIYSIDYGIYSHNYTNEEIKESKEEYIEKGYKMYKITNNSNYLYMIRETGGMITGAYIDNRNKEIGNNPYYNSNVGSESYVIYLGYLTNKEDLDMLTINQDKYINLLTEPIIKELRI